MANGLHASTTRVALPPYGINRNRLDSLLIHYGGAVVDVRRTGEIAYTHPALPQRARANGRRKDAGAHLVRFVREVMLRRRESDGVVDSTNSTKEH